MKRLNSGQFFYIVIRKGCKECVFLCQSHIDQIFRKRWQNYGHFSHSNCDLAAFRSQSPLEALVPIPLLTEVLSQLNEVPQFGQLFSHCDSDSRPHCDGSCIGRESDPASLGTEDNSTTKCAKVNAALAGNRTRASRVAGENSTTEPPMPVLASVLDPVMSQPHI